MPQSWPMLFTKTAGGAINYWQVWTEGPYVWVRWGKVGTDNEQKDWYEAEGKNIGRSNETSPAGQAEKEAQSKFDKQIRLKYVRTIEEAQNNINIKPMLAYVYDEKRAKKLQWPVTVQPKFNGVRCMAYNLPDGSVRLMSRGGKDYSLPHIQSELRGRIAPGWCLDGELYVHGTSLQTIRHFIETPTDHTQSVQLFCYDKTSIPPEKHTWNERCTLLAQWFEQNKGVRGVVPSPMVIANSHDHVESAHDQWVQQGFEGVIIRNPIGPYKLAGRSTHLLKYKKFIDAEFPIVGYGVGKDGVIIYTCQTDHGALFEVRPMGSAEERHRLLQQASTSIGQLLTVRYQELSDDKIPIFPVGVSLRCQKDL